MPEKNKAEVSIIVPVFNVEKYVSGCIESLVNQTFANTEIILVNDGSKDGSKAICEKFSEKDERVKVIHKENGGLSSARNAGLVVAKGKYVLFVDGDDYLAQNAVEILVNSAEKISADVIQFDYTETHDEYKPVHILHTPNGTLVSEQKKMFEMLYKIGGAAASACTKMYKRELFDELKFKEGIIHEDEHFTTYLLQKVKSVLYIEDKLYFYVMRGGSIVKSAFSRKKLDFFYVSEIREKELYKLTYYDLAKKEKARRFTNGIDMWCKAKKAGDFEAMKIIEEKIKSVLGEKLPLKGKFTVIFALLKVNFSFINLYYFYRQKRGQI